MVSAVAAEVIRSLPADLRGRASGVIFVASDLPTREQVESVAYDDEPGDDLLGIYEGTPLTERSIDQASLLPDRISLFRIPLMEMCRTRKELREEVRITILHELAHFFGFEETDLEERGLG
jgi:predicted Zn-dependent protease with MMP-like domain